MSEGLGVYLLFAFHMAVAHHDAAVADDGVHQNHLAASVDEVVLKTAAVADIIVEFVYAFFAAKGKRLGIEAVGTEFYCSDFHVLCLKKGR